MKILLVLRGVSGCGKSTWVYEHYFENYTLSADKIRLLYASPEFDIDGHLIISPRFDRKVWQFLFERLEERMKNGDFTIVDATHVKESSLKEYKSLCKKYNYRMIIVDFSTIDIDIIKQRNLEREIYVPEHAIDRMYKQIQIPLQGKYEIYNYEDPVLLDLNSLLYTVDGNKYSKVVVFGDLHNCYEPVKEYFDKNPESDNNLYIFVGDYFDRGIQAREVLQFCLDHCNKENFIFLQGNHEIWAKNYVKEGMSGKMTDAFRVSLAQFGELKDRLGEFTRRLKLQVMVEFGKHVFCVTHGGLSQPISYVTPAMQCIKGVGSYEDLESVEEAFKKVNEIGLIKDMGMTFYTIHGHRNINHAPIIDGCAINLEDNVEWGGNLRIVELSYDSDMHINPIEIKNTIFAERNLEVNIDNKSIIKDLDSSSLIHKKNLEDGIVSYNFSREAFYSQKWNKLTTTARGLFIDSNTLNIVARSYPKFFEVEQHPSTQWRNLEKNLKFPMEVFLKENGFLVIVSVYNGELFIASKSTNQGEYKENFERILRAQVNIDKLKEYLQANNCSAIFECVDPYNDPHIIKYVNERVVLLDVVQNDFTDTFKSYNDLMVLAADIGCRVKSYYAKIKDIDELKSFINLYNNNKDEIEGFVLVDQNHFMLKYKTPFYKFWKQMRNLKERMIKEDIPEDKFLSYNVSEQYSDLVPKVYNFMNGIKNSGDKNLEALSIIDIRELYYEQFI